MSRNTIEIPDAVAVQVGEGSGYRFSHTDTPFSAFRCPSPTITIGESEGHVDINDVIVKETRVGGKLVDVQFTVLLHQEAKLINSQIDVDLGIPALSLEVDGNVDVTLGYDFLLGFGVSEDLGFYFDTSQENELTVELAAGISDLALIKGKLAFLQLVVTDGVPPTSLLARTISSCKARPSRWIRSALRAPPM